MVAVVATAAEATVAGMGKHSEVIKYWVVAVVAWAFPPARVTAASAASVDSVDSVGSVGSVGSVVAVAHLLHLGHLHRLRAGSG